MRRCLALAVVCLVYLLVPGREAVAIDIGTLLDTCPTHDPAYQQLRSDFELRRNGVPVGDIPCAEPISQLPTAQYTDEIIVMQSLRAVLAMDFGGTSLPWAPGMRLYDWMKAEGVGINIDTSATSSSCCVTVDNKPFFTYRAQDALSRDGNRQWFTSTGIGVAGVIGLLAHELRHHDGDGHPHVRCCSAQTPTGSAACDQSYDETNLGSYGVQYWLNAHWLAGDAYTGFSCLPAAEVTGAASGHAFACNNARTTRFCDTLPPPVSIPATPGGQCRTPPGLVDVYILVDLSGSFIDDLPAFQAEAPAVIAQLSSGDVDLRVGLGTFQDYPVAPFGDATLGDQAYRRLADISADTPDHAQLLATIASLQALNGAGADAPQSQLAAMYQAATGAGEDLSGAGFPGASIPAGLQAHFRDGAAKIVLLWTDSPFHHPGDPGAIPYPGPTMAAVTAALQALDPARVVGLSSGPDALPDLQAIAAATGAVAGPGGVDCDADGVTDVPAGAPLVCELSSSGPGIGKAIRGLVNGVVAASAPVARCKDVTVTASAQTCHAPVSVDAGSFDPDGGPVTLLQSAPGPYPAGASPITLSAVDQSGLASECAATITVRDVTAPVLTFVPPPITISSCTRPNIGLARASDACGPVTVTNNAPQTFRVGQTIVTWTARDAAGNVSTATQTVTATLGNDASCCPAGAHVIVGTSNNDTLTGTAGVDCILGLGGQDSISGLGGNDVISGGEGDDIISAGDGDDVVFGGPGQDTIDGGNGNDTLDGQDGDDRVAGGAGNDTLFGGAGQDRLTGGDGDDQLHGQSGDDVLDGGNGNDVLEGGGLHDTCIGGGGTNIFLTCEHSQ